MFPNGNLRLDVIDQTTTGGKSLRPVRRTHGHYDRELAYLEVPHPVGHRDGAHRLSGGDLGRDPLDLRHGAWMRFVSEIGHPPIIVVVPDRPHEQRDPAHIREEHGGEALID